jgi:hypothetical protein
MGITTFSGPIRAGTINTTTGTTLGENVRNVGSVVMVQTVPITQAGTTTALATNIVLPPNSHILNIQVLQTTAWATTTTISIGTSVTANELVAAQDLLPGTNLLSGLGPGTSATRAANWDDTGTTDKRIWVLSGGGTGGVGTLTVRYIQAHDLVSSP